MLRLLFFGILDTDIDLMYVQYPTSTLLYPLVNCSFIQARKFGVRAAMPGFIAQKLCPELIFVPTDFKKYIYYSDLTRKGNSSVDLIILGVLLFQKRILLMVS